MKIPPTALVTGASRGIGWAIAQKLATQGYSVMLAARNEALLEERRKELPTFDENQVHGVWPMDLADPGADLSLNFPLDLLVNNAGMVKTALAGVQDPADIERIVRTNLTAPLVLTKYAVRNMLRDKRRGSIFFVGSAVAHRAVPGGAVYAATKGAVEAYARTLAREIGSRGIRVNTIVPGLVDTDMGHSTSGLAQSNAVLAGKLIEPKWVAETMWNVLENPHMTGSTVVVDNGFSI